MTSYCLLSPRSSLCISSGPTAGLAFTSKQRISLESSKPWHAETGSGLKKTNFVRDCGCTKATSYERSFPLSSSPWEDSLEYFLVDVVGAEATELNVRLLAPFTIATTKLEFVENVAIRVELRDGSVGYGEAPTLPPVTAEDQPMALQRAAETCKFLEVQSRLPLRKLLESISGICPGHEFASVRAGVEMAVVDAVSRSRNLPLWKFFGGHGRSIVTDITVQFTEVGKSKFDAAIRNLESALEVEDSRPEIPISPPEEAEDLARMYFARGFTTIKTKVGGRDISSDIALLKAIRRGHPLCSLILDANCGYSAQAAIQVLEELHESGLTPCLFEQPVMRDDWEGLGQVSKVARELYGVPVAADESCRNINDARFIIERGLVEVVNVKLAKMGVLEALELIGLVKRAGLDLMIGGMVETRLAMGFAGHVAAGLGCFRYFDLDTPLLLAEDPVHRGYEGEYNRPLFDFKRVEFLADAINLNTAVDGAVYRFTDDFGHGGSIS